MSCKATFFCIAVVTLTGGEKNRYSSEKILRTDAF